MNDEWWINVWWVIEWWVNEWRINEWWINEFTKWLHKYDSQYKKVKIVKNRKNV